MAWFPWEHPNLVADIRQPNPRPVSHALFREPEQSLRPMRVMVDADLQLYRSRDQKVDYLLQLLATPPIESMLFAPEGPPVTALRARDGETGVESFVDWIAVDFTGVEENSQVRHWEGGRPVVTPLLRTDSMLSQGSHDRARAVLIGDRINCDMLITGKDTLPRAPISDWSRLTVMTAYDALPLVGLYLRRQGEFVKYRSPALGQGPSHNDYVGDHQSEFFRKAAQTFIPAAAFGPSSHRATFTVPESNAYRKAIIWRIQQALQARDRLLHTLAVAPRDYQTADRAASELELILMWLMAGFDVTARLIHIEYGLATSPTTAGWQQQKWRGALKPIRPDLASFFRGDAEAGAVLAIVQSLRNSIHGAQPVSGSGLTFVVGRSAMQCLVDVPKDDRRSLINAVEKLGGLKAWGVQRDRSRDELWIHPGQFVERLVPLAAAAINGSLETDPDPDRRAAPIGGPYELQLHEKRTLWQLGFQESDVPER